jgi:TatD DNase family protein
MELIDTHTHLFLDNFDKDIDDVINRAIQNNITKMFCPNIDLSTIEKLNSLTQKYPKKCFPLIGLHPESVKENFQDDLDKIKQLLTSDKYYGIGEIGIDLYWDKKYKQQQIQAFQSQVKLAKKLKLPIVIHVREAFDEIFKIIDSEIDQDLKGIFHCFTGNLQQAQHIIEYKNFKLGIGGILTYKNSDLKDTIKHIDLEHIVLETDSPFLSPVPKRGKRNESSFLIYIAEFLSKIKNIPLTDIAQITTKNANEIFSIKSIF